MRFLARIRPVCPLMIVPQRESPLLHNSQMAGKCRPHYSLVEYVFNLFLEVVGQSSRKRGQVMLRKSNQARHHESRGCAGRPVESLYNP